MYNAFSLSSRKISRRWRPPIDYPPDFSHYPTFALNWSSRWKVKPTWSQSFLPLRFWRRFFFQSKQLSSFPILRLNRSSFSGFTFSVWYHACLVNRKSVLTWLFERAKGGVKVCKGIACNVGSFCHNFISLSIYLRRWLIAWDFLINWD